MVDTLGELKTIYSIADVVIVAGSMLDHLIGHNPIEPASLGKPVIVGPYMSSFNDVMDKFLHRKAMIQLQKAEELADQVAALFEHPEIRERMGFLAKTIVEECSGATAKYLDILGRLLPK
jgi:3-deoxy-D-manno-octulosonic-acid transferase